LTTWLQIRAVSIRPSVMKMREPTFRPGVRITMEPGIPRIHKDLTLSEVL